MRVMPNVLRIVRLAAAGAAGALVVTAAAAGAQDTAYERFRRDQERQLRAYQEAQDRDFAEFLVRQWHMETGARDAAPAALPKPRVMPAAADAPVVPAGAPAVVVVAPTPTPTPTPGPLSPIPARSPITVRATPAPTPLAGPATTVSFFGSGVPMPLVSLDVQPLRGAIHERAIAGFWNQMSSADWRPLLADALAQRDRLRLPDWGFCQLLRDMGRRQFPDDASRATLFVWFMLLKAGYAAKVGYAGTTVYLLVATAEPVYFAPRFGGDSSAFYALPLDGRPRDVDRIYTYTGSYPGASRRVDLRFAEPPAFAAGTITRTLHFTYGGVTHDLAVPVDRGLAAFLEWYPRVDMPVYFGAAMSTTTADALLPQLRAIIAAKPPVEAARILLRFVQTAFAYRTDEEQFGRDKPFFPDETIFYPASDCEDRAVLFAYLVRTLVGLPAIGLQYPNHVATAVRYPAELPGGAVEYRGTRYVISDPTYINADIGMVMPQYRGVAPTVIELPSAP